MNYKAELRGFALDRATQIAKLSDGATFKDVKKMADEIVEYLYLPEKDLKSHIESISKLIQETGDFEIVETLLLELNQLKAEYEAQIKRAS